MKYKKYLSFILSALFLYSIMVLPVQATEVTDRISMSTVVQTSGEALTSGDYEYEVNDEDQVTITKYNGSESEITIPDRINEKVVNSIGENAFKGNTTITSVVIPKGVTTIELYAFYNCNKLISVSIPDSVTVIRGAVFTGCSSLKSIAIPNGVTSIGKETFYGCNSLNSITIPDTVRSIGSSAFYQCSSLTSINIPSGVTSIGSAAFSGCSNLTSINIPSGVTSIGNATFSGCSSLTSITIPNGVKSIGSYAFSSTGLTSIIIPNSVTSIGKGAFYTCSSLTSVTISYSVSRIEESTFYGCYNLSSVTIPSSVSYIGYAAFNWCLSLKNITIPNSVTTIDDAAFCVSGLTSITIPSSVQQIDSDVFSGCKSLTSVNLPNSITSIGLGAFEECTKLKSINIPNNVTSIGENAFKECEALESINIPKSVRYIGSGSFKKCTSLNNIIIPDNVTIIYTSTFEECKSLANITIPDTVTKINESAFKNCENLKDVYYYGNSAQWESITIGENNEYLKNATLNYIYTVTWKNHDGTILEKDKNVDYGSTPQYNGLTPTKPKTDKYTYTFSKWSPDITSVTESVTYTAQFSETINTYTVTWQNYNGTILETDRNVAYGDIPTYDSATPTRENTSQYIYTFKGWSPSVSEVTGNVTYTAQYSSTLKSYTVKWKNYDGTELETDTNVSFGTVPTYNGLTPTRENTPQYNYTFTGWEPKISSVTGDITYTAQFKTTVNNYTVKWENYDGTVLETDRKVPYGSKPKYNGSTPQKLKTAQFTYTFEKWSPDISPVTGDVTYTAQFISTVNDYTVTWKNYDGTILEIDENVEYGTIPTYDGTIPEREKTIQNSYAFKGWDKDITGVTEDVTFTAQFTSTNNKYTVTWKNYDGTVLMTDENAEYGTVPKYNGVTPKKEKNAQYNYVFDKWSPEVSPVTGDVTYTAEFTTTEETYTVTWKNYDGSILKEYKNVEYGSVPRYYGARPTKSADAQYTYTFKGWDKPFEEVTEDITYTAQFTSTLNKYNVTWKNYDGTVLNINKNVEYGTIPTYDGIVPTKPRTTQYTYIFDRWSPDMSPVTGDVTYTAEYESKANVYTVKWKNYDGTVLETDKNIKYGTIPTYDGVTPTKPKTAEYTYTFDKWSPDVSPVTGYATYTAQFTTTINKYSVTFESNGGSKVNGQKIEYGKTAAEPNKPTKDGNRFKGWYNGDTVFDFNTPITEDLILTAQWEKEIVSETDINTDTDKKDTNSDKPDTSTEKTDTTTDKPDTSTEKTDTTTDKPDTSTDNTDTTTDKPDTSTEKSDTTSDKPDTSTEKSDTTTDKPDTSTEKTDTTTDKSDTSTEKLDTTTDKPDTSTEKLDTTTDKPDTSTDNTDTTTEKPDTSTDNTDSDTESDKPNTPDTPDKPEKVLLGDVDGDGKISAKDSLAIQRYVINLKKLDSKQIKAADVDGDNKVTNKDAIIILRFTINIKVKYPIGELV